MSESSASAPPGVLQSLSHDLTAAVEHAGASVVAIHARRRIPASGTIWRPGIVVAAHHTIQRDEGITVTLADGSSVAATLIGRDPTTDIAALRLDGSSGSAADIAAGDDIKVGQLVLALGRPGASVTASLGIVSAAGGEWRTWHGGRIDRFVRLDLDIYDGFSGGPLVNPRGRVLGLNTSALARAAAMAIPASTINRVLDQLLATGRVQRGYIGLGMQPVRLPESLVRQLGVERDVALMVVSIEDGGPAHKAGVMLGDVMVKFDGKEVSDPTELLAMLAGERVGSTATATVVRAGTAQDITVTIGERPHRSQTER